ncbi:Conserved fungal protein [Taphrina deformans PYCC 5710]|uniref:Conserved fungal protein n=1 Tax=Taphrina deformans (strain PYCC 5710 / ATCC 11124 / CBS 356.35 / IMI 108563 / JCM 9778 / NBRC 8474) TaxID=1097556 RepID=R4XFC5_TAPDE|nr:Conserved fungal protein [Taphrina deformans PYCC 5710]|eukprot:CCG83146.1 Conserved fungal protein [Taphrina deformans PYCC 5710]
MGLFSKKKGDGQTTTAPVDPPSQGARPVNGRSTGAQSNLQNGSKSAIPELPAPRPIDPNVDPVAYLKSLHSIRERSQKVYAQRHRLQHFDFHEGNIQNVVKFVLSIIKRDYGSDYGSIPPHGRWQHFEVGGRKRVDELLATFSAIDATERTRRIIDLFLVSVLLDAGAGNKWTYKANNGKVYRRSEGLAVASLEMFQTGMFSSDPRVKTQVDAQGLRTLTPQTLGAALQVSPSNPMSGLEGRTQLLMRLSEALSSSAEIFGATGRPGHLVDYLLSHPATVAFPGGHVVSATLLWSVLLDGLSSIWPAGRTHVEGRSLGDAWPYSGLPREPAHAGIAPFHKLSQWLAYSLMAPMTKLLNIHFAHSDLLTGLPEYRNGGLFVDLGVLTLKMSDTSRGTKAFTENGKIAGQQSVEVVPLFDPGDDVIVEWRAMTVCLLDQVHLEINRSLGLSGARALSLPQILEAGTWKAGREIAEVQRPNTRGSPIALQSDGTVF